MSSDKKYFYKILDSPPPEPLPEKLPETELDIKDNFIHLSVRPFLLNKHAKQNHHHHHHFTHPPNLTQPDQKTTFKKY